MDTEVIDRKDRLDRVGDRVENFAYGDDKNGATQRGALRYPIGLDVGRGEVIGNSDLE